MKLRERHQVALYIAAIAAGAAGGLMLPGLASPLELAITPALGLLLYATFLGVLFVLLTPCVDYVIVFSRLAGGAHDRLLAATPLLMFLQLLAAESRVGRAFERGVLAAMVPPPGDGPLFSAA